MRLNAQLQASIEALRLRTPELSPERKEFLDPLISGLIQNLQNNQATSILCMCTHNSRRSQLGMAWIYAMSRAANLPIEAHSAGTEVTACQIRTLKDLAAQGFIVTEILGDNPKHLIRVHETDSGTQAWSKLATDPSIPSQGVHAWIYCDHAASHQLTLDSWTARTEPFLKDSPTPGPELQHSPIQDRIAVEWIYVFDQVMQQFSPGSKEI
jgi:arsenate reductase